MDAENDNKNNPLENYKINIKKRSSINFVIYLIRRCPLPKFIYYIVLIVQLIQTYLFTVIPLTRHSDSQNLVPLLKLFSKIVLIDGAYFSNFEFIRHIFYLYILYFIVYLYSITAYKKAGVLKPFFCYAFMLTDTILHTILVPMIVLQCLTTINLYLQIQLESSDVILFATCVLFMNIFGCFKYIFFNNFLLLSIHPTENILYLPYFLYFTLMPLFSSIGYIFSNPYYYLFPGTFSFIYGLLFFAVPYINSDIFGMVTFTVSLTVGSSVYCYNFITKYTTQSSIICINIAFAGIVIVIRNWLIKSVKRKAKEMIKSTEFVDECKNAKQAAKYYAYAAMEGCPQIFECIHVESLQRRFGEDTIVSYFLCVSEMALPQFPSTVITKPAGFLKGDEVFCEMHQRMTNPCSKEDIISMHHICALDIYNSLKKCSDSLITITDLIFNESFNILSFNTLRSYDIFSESFQHIIVFMQMFPNSPYIQNITDIFLAICPSAYHKREIEFWMDINYSGPFEKDKTIQNDNKSKYEYTSILKKSPNRTQKFKDIADEFTERKIDSYIEQKGPFSYSRKGFFLWFAFIGIVVIHLAYFTLIQMDFKTAIFTTRSIMQTYDIIQNMTNISNYVPLYALQKGDFIYDPNLYTEETFTYFHSVLDFCMNFLNMVRRYGYSTYNDFYYKKLYSYMSDFNSDKHITAFQQLYSNVLYLFESVLNNVGDNVAAPNISKEVYCSYIHNLHQFNRDLYSTVSQAEDYPTKILHFKSIYIILIYIGLYVVVFSIIILLFYTGYKREHSFYYELKKVSKSFLVKLKAFYKKVSESSLEIENQFILAKKSDDTITKPIYLPFLTLIYLPTFLLFIFSIIAITMAVLSVKCYVATVNNRMESYGYLINFDIDLSKVCIDSVLFVYNESCISKDDIIKSINSTLAMMSNHSSMLWGQKSSFCSTCYTKYYQIFADSETLIEQESSIWLKMLTNILTTISNENASLSDGSKAQVYRNFYNNLGYLVEFTSQEIKHCSNSNIINMPIIFYAFHFVIMILIIVYIIYIFMLQTHFDIPYFVLSLTLSNAKTLNGNNTITDIIEESFDLSTKKEEKKLQNCTKEFCDKMTTPVMIIDCELKLLYSNDEASRIFLISKDFKDNLSLFEILKDGFIEEGTNKKIGQLINEFAYREFHTIRTYKILGSINSVSDHILSAKEKNMKTNYELSIFPIYTTQKHFSQLILIFTPEAEYANYSNFLAKYRKLPVTIRNEWIMKDFQITQLKRSNIIKETKSGIVAIVRVKTDFGEKAPQIIDQVFRRFDVIISQSKVFRYYRTHASMYCFGTDFSHEMEFTPYIIHKIILILRQMFDEAGKVSLSKNVDVDAYSSVGFGNVIIGIPGKEHPFLEVWGAAITDALDMIKVAKLNKVMIRKRVLDQNNLSGIMPELVIPMKSPN